MGRLRVFPGLPGGSPWFPALGCTFSALSKGLCWLRAFQSKNHKFREPRDLTNFGSQLTLSTVVILPTPPCKAEKLRLRQRAAARYPCVRASPKIQFNRHRVSERAAPSRERPTPSWPSRSLLVQDASSSGASKSIYLRKYRNQ